VAAGLIADDPSDPRPTLLAFASGGALFFGAMFAGAWWQTRPRPHPELDALLAELSVSPATGGTAALAVMGRVARAYIALGAIVTALGLVAIVQEGLGFGNPRLTLGVMVAIVVVWAMAVPWVLGRAREASAAVLGPLGLAQEGATIEGERHGRRVRIDLTASGSTTNVESGGEWIVIRRADNQGASWLWDLQRAERQASE
jgi:hypothetical protein